MRVVSEPTSAKPHVGICEVPPGNRHSYLDGMRDMTTSEIVLIGGCSSVGKTTVACALRDMLGREHVQVDRILRTMPRDQGTREFIGDPEQLDLPVDELVAMIVSKRVTLAEHLPHLFQTWQHEGVSVVLEGEGITPDLTAGFRFNPGALAVFIVETDRDQMYRNLVNRSERFAVLNEPRKRKLVEMNCVYGEWLQNEAIRYRMPWLTAQPWETLRTRVVQALQDVIVPLQPMVFAGNGAANRSPTYKP